MSRPESASEEGNDFVGKLTARQLQAFETLRELLARPSKLLIWHHDVGRQVCRLRENMPAWKHGWFRSLAKYLDVSVSTLRKQAMLNEEYSASEVRELDDRGVGWGMMTVVMHVPKEARQGLLDRAVEKKWGVIELKAAARRRFRKRNVGGRPMSQPESIEEGLQQLQEQARRWFVYYSEVWLSSFRGGWRSLPRKQSEAAFQAKLKAARKSIERVQAAARSIKNTLDELKKDK